MGERKHAEPELDDIFLALSHPTRRRMLEMLQTKSYRVTELAQSFELSLNVVSKHLKYLERAGLLQREQEGRVHNLHGDTEALKPAVEWLSEHLRMWTGALNSLERFIVKTNQEKSNESPETKES